MLWRLSSAHIYLDTAEVNGGTAEVYRCTTEVYRCTTRINVDRHRGGDRHDRRGGAGVAMDVQTLLVVAVTSETLRIPTIVVEAHHVITSLVVTERVETGAVVALRIVAECVETGRGVALRIVAVVVETGSVESKNVVAVDVEAGRVVDVLRGGRLATLVDVADRVALVGPPGLYSVVSDAVDGEAVEVGLGDEGLHCRELRTEIDGLTARQLVLTALEGLDTEDALHSAVLGREEAVEVDGEIECGEHETLLGCEGRSSNESHLLLG